MMKRGMNILRGVDEEEIGLKRGSKKATRGLEEGMKRGDEKLESDLESKKCQT